MGALAIWTANELNAAYPGWYGVMGEASGCLYHCHRHGVTVRIDRVGHNAYTVRQ